MLITWLGHNITFIKFNTCKTPMRVRPPVNAYFMGHTVRIIVCWVVTINQSYGVKHDPMSISLFWMDFVYWSFNICWMSPHNYYAFRYLFNSWCAFYARKFPMPASIFKMLILQSYSKFSHGRGLAVRCPICDGFSTY